MKNISQIPLKGKRVLIRVDFNVPLDKNFNITDDSRIVASLPTIKTIISKGGMAIIISHLGRPTKGFEEKYSLKHTVKKLEKLLDTSVIFSSDCIGESAITNVLKMNNGEVIILENLRFYSEETNGDEKFAKKLASLADIYVNDAFGAAHRAHASTAVIANFFPNNKYFGLLISNEIASLEKALSNPKKPFTAIIGGSKITGKIDVITALFEKVDNLIIGGGMAYTFSKAKGGDIGKSLVENEKLALAKKLIDTAKKKGVKLFLPTDSLNAHNFNPNAKTNISNIMSIDDDYIGLDIGPDSIKKFSEIIKKSKTLIWNGPMGVFEMKKYENGTKQIGKAISIATDNGAFSLVGGGDSVSAVKKFRFTSRISYISTGGGAMLEYLEGKKLPGIVAIEN